MDLLQRVDNESSLVQIKMTLDGRFIATVSVPDNTGAFVSVRRSFKWNHTSSLILVDVETKQTAAVMHGLAFGLAKCFVLEIQVSFGYSFEVLLVTSAMTMYENLRRENSKHSAGRRGPSTAAQAAVASQSGFMGGMGDS